MRYMKPETENAIGCLSAVFWPLSVVMAIFGLIYRDKHPSPYANPAMKKYRQGKKPVKPQKTTSIQKDVDPWDLPDEKMPWE